MFDIGFPELIIILIIALIIFGAGKLPGIGTSLGEAIRNFKRASSESEIDVTPQREELRSAPSKPEGPAQKV